MNSGGGLLPFRLVDHIAKWRSGDATVGVDAPGAGKDAFALQEMEFLEAAREAAHAAGRVLEEWAAKFTVTEKSPANLVTEADVAAQEAIRQILAARFPDHDFLGEEGGRPGPRSSPYRWIVDPLDGTSNYVHRFPYYAVSIALERAGERPGAQAELLVGVIFDPNRQETFSAVRGRGAFLNETPARPSQVESLDRAMVVASLPVKVQADDPALARFLRVIPQAQTVQRTGSAALNLAYVACGRIDAFWSSSLKPWDMAAGVLIVREAGGRVTQAAGGPFDLNVPDLLSSNGTGIHEELQQLLSSRSVTA